MLLAGVCLLVNYVTVDEKMNMSEELTMISFYAMIVSKLAFHFICILLFTRIGIKRCGTAGYGGVVLRARALAAAIRIDAQLSRHQLQERVRWDLKGLGRT